jgi:hypothetical protein
MAHQINTRYNLFQHLAAEADVTPLWLTEEIRECFGTKAENFNPPLRYLARYKYTEDFEDFACICGVADDRLPIIGPGLEIVIQNPWNIVRSNQQMQTAKGRMLVKDHSPENDRIRPFFDAFRLRYFPEATLTEVSTGNETSSGVTGYLISFEVHYQQNRHGGDWVLR